MVYCSFDFFISARAGGLFYEDLYQKEKDIIHYAERFLAKNDCSISIQIKSLVRRTYLWLKKQKQHNNGMKKDGSER